MNYVHSVPGRLRVKTASVKKNPAGADRVEKLLALIPGVYFVETNVLTGSVLVRYTPKEVSCEHLLAVMREGGCIDQPHPVHFVGSLEEPLVKGGRAIGRLLFRQLVEKQIERFALSLVGALV
jgi:hypothetical protein